MKRHRGRLIAVAAAAIPVLALTACAGGSGEDQVDFTTTGNTSLRYDGSAGQWIQNWKTPNVSGDTCYRTIVRFADWSSIEAFFKLRR